MMQTELIDDGTKVRVTFEWSTKHGTCYDCGLPAAYSFPQRYNPQRYHYPATVGGRPEDLLCSVCFAGAVVDNLNIGQKLFDG
jgi:hypothetical protein